MSLFLCVFLACSSPAEDSADPPADTADTGELEDALPCDGEPGAFHEEHIAVDGLDRVFFLYVPSSYACEDAWPVLLDFHGTVGSKSGDVAAEEAYGQDALVDLAEAEGFIVMRPRSLSSDWGGYQVYQWDVELDANLDFTEALLEHVDGLYHLDPDRLYVSGFSNGTNMATQALRLGLGFDGLAVIGGGEWGDPDLEDLDGLRVYATTGFRDYMYPYQRDLWALLDAQGHDAALRFERQTDAGHDLYSWHWAELWGWLDQGVGQAEGALDPSWTRQDFPSEESLTGLAAGADGRVVASGAEGGIYLFSDGVWSRTAALDSTWSDLCMDGDVGLAVGEGALARSEDGGQSWSLATPIPDFHGMWGDGNGHANGVACADGVAVAAGYWSGATSWNGGLDWEAADIDSVWGSAGQSAAVDVSSAGTWMLSGYYYRARSEDGQQFDPKRSPAGVDWLLDAAPGEDGRWWMVGEGGAVSYSDDDGLTWDSRDVPEDVDLYAVDFDGLMGLAVGRGGAAFFTEDGGLAWRDVSTGLDAFLGDVRWMDEGCFMVVGERGLVLSFEP